MRESERNRGRERARAREREGATDGLTEKRREKE